MWSFITTRCSREKRRQLIQRDVWRLTLWLEVHSKDAEETNQLKILKPHSLWRNMQMKTWARTIFHRTLAYSTIASLPFRVEILFLWRQPFVTWLLLSRQHEPQPMNSQSPSTKKCKCLFPFPFPFFLKTGLLDSCRLFRRTKQVALSTAAASTKELVSEMSRHKTNFHRISSFNLCLRRWHLKRSSVLWSNEGWFPPIRDSTHRYWFQTEGSFLYSRVRRSEQRSIQAGET